MFVLSGRLNEADSKYLDDIFTNNQGIIRYTAVRILKNYSEEDVKDCVMDVFCIACIKIDDLKASPNPTGWLVNTAKNVCMNFIRRSATVYKHGVEESEEYIFTQSSFENDIVENMVYEQWMRNHVTTRILHMLNKSEREYYNLKYRKGLSAEDIAKRKNKSIGSVRVGISRMEKNIRRIVLRREFEKNK